MIANHVHDALRQVDRLRELVLDRRRFLGYSGKARVIGGVVALSGAAAIYAFRLPVDPWLHFFAWCGVLAVALILNYGGLFLWFAAGGGFRGELSRLAPALDAVPSLAVGAFATVALPLRGAFDLLPPIWMCLYGLTHVPYRLNLPRSNYYVGLFYISAGVLFLLWRQPFTNPWPMGVVFFVGEVAGGISLTRWRGGEVCDG